MPGCNTAAYNFELGVIASQLRDLAHSQSELPPPQVIGLSPWSQGAIKVI